MKALPTAIRDLRFMLELTQRELALKCEVSVTTVWNWEKGKRKPQPHNGKRLMELAREYEEQLRVVGYYARTSGDGTWS